jgi:hypothetical protein
VGSSKLKAGTCCLDKDRDRFAVYTGLLPLLTAAIVGILSSFRPMSGLLLRPIGFMVLLIWAISSTFRAVRPGWRRCWRRTSSLVVLLVAIWPAVGFLTFRSGDFVHLAVMLPAYERAIQASSSDMVVFDWGLVGAFLVGTQRSLVFKSRTPPTPDDFDLFTGHYSDVGIYHLWGNFYVVERPA